MKKRRLWGAVIYGGLILLLPAVLWLLLALADARSEAPVFMGYGNYWRLFLQDDVFMRILLQAYVLPATLCLAVLAGFVVLKRLVLDRWRSRLRDPVCYAGLTVLLFGLLVFRLPEMLGLPVGAYSAQGMVHYRPVVVDILADPLYLTAGCIMLESSLILGLIAWLFDRFLPRRAAKREQAPGT